MTSKEWKNYKLSDFMEFNPNETLTKGSIAKKVAMENLKPYNRDIFDYEYAPYNGGVKFRNGDTIMARITPCLENGKTSKVNILEDNEIAFGSTEYIVFRKRDNISDENFIYYLVTSPKIREIAIKSMVGSSGRQRVQADVLANLELELPPLETQKKIAGVLSSLDDKIELNNKINQNLEQQAQAIFDKFFGSCQIENKIIGDYLTPKRGKNLLSKDTKDGNIPVIAGGLKPAAYHNIANTTAPVITISASGANAGYVNLWQIPVWASDSSYIDSTINPYIYFWYILLKKRQKEIFDSQTGSAQPHIYPKHIEQMAIFDLNIINVKNYNDMIQPLFETIGNNLSENKQLTQLRDTLLPKLMSGEINVDKVEV